MGKAARCLAEPAPTSLPDCEELPETGETWIHIAMVRPMLKRLKPT
jgi:hypothetical protein